MAATSLKTSPTKQQTQQIFTLVFTHWGVRLKDFGRCLTCCDRGGRCSLTHSQQLCCRYKIWMTEMCLYQKTSCSANSPQELAPTNTARFIHTQSTLKVRQEDKLCSDRLYFSFRLVTIKAAMFRNRNRAQWKGDSERAPKQATCFS